MKNIGRKKLIILVMAAGLVLAAAAELAECLGGRYGPVTSLQRNPRGGSEKVETVRVEGVEGIKKLEVHLSAQSFGEKELGRLSEELFNMLEERFEAGIGNTGEFPELPDRVEGYPFILVWESSNPAYLSDKGRPSESIPAEGEVVTLTLYMRNIEEGFEQIYTFPVRVYPPPDTRSLEKRFRDYLEAEEKKNDEEAFTLPQDFEGRRLTYRKSGRHPAIPIIGISFAAAAAIYMREEEKKKELEKKRLQFLRREYPEFVSKTALFIGAGMTVQGALRKIASEYTEKQKSVRSEACEELIKTLREIDNGTGDARALGNMGNRCKLAPYVKYTSILASYIKRGGTGMRTALFEEMREAMRVKRDTALMAGDTAKTKLLAPMMMQLFMIMIMIMVPAFLAFTN